MSDTLSLLSSHHGDPLSPLSGKDDLLRSVGGGGVGRNADLSAVLSARSSENQWPAEAGSGTTRVTDVLAVHQAQGDDVRALVDQMTANSASRTSIQKTASSVAPKVTEVLAPPGDQVAQKIAVPQAPLTDKDTGLPKLQFLSHDTALKTDTSGTGQTGSMEKGKVAQTVPAASGTSSDLMPTSRSFDMGGYDVPAYSYAVQNGNGGTDTISFNDHFNQILPGVSVNTSFDDIGERRDGAWKQPTMHAYPSPDSGYRADQVQAYFLDNADTIGRNVLGVPIPADRIQNLRDFIHGEIKQHHRGNQETISKVLHLLATQDAQTSTQLNNIWHAVLGRAINPDELSDAISQISIGHATLQTELWTVTHSQEAANHLKETISAVQDRPVNQGDEAWIRGQQDSMGRGEQNLRQIRQNLAHWTANNGQYDQPFRDDHGRDPGPQDREYAGNMIGNGWSVQDYRWNEAHSDIARNEIHDLYRNTGGVTPWPEQVTGLQDALGHGYTTVAKMRGIIASREGNIAIIKSYSELGLGTPDARQIQPLQDALARGETTQLQIRQDLARNAANNGQYDQIYRDTHDRDPGPLDHKYMGTMMGNGWSVQDYRWSEAHSDAVSIGIMDRLRNENYFNNGALNLNNEIDKLQDDLGNGKITYHRIMSLIDLGAKLSSIDQNSGNGHYTPVPGHSPDSSLYTDGSGRQFWVTNKYSFQDIVNDAKNAPSYAHPLDLQEAIRSSIGHGGKFDAQRDSATHILFQDNVDNANYNVGVWSAAYGMTEAEMHLLGMSYIATHSASASESFSTYTRDAPLWEQGYVDYNRGYINR